MTNRYKDMQAAVSDMFITLIVTAVLHTWVLKYVLCAALKMPIILRKATYWEMTTMGAF